MAKPVSTVLLHYVRPADGRSVWIQGMVHVAPKMFFDTVNRNIRRFLTDYPETGLVLLEKITPATADKNRAEELKAEVGRIMSRLTKVEGFTLERAYRLVAQIADYETQFDDRYLDGVPSAKTQIADMSTEQFVAFLFGQKAIADLMVQEPFKFKYRLASFERWANWPLVRNLAAWLLKRGLRGVLRDSDPDAAVPKGREEKTEAAVPEHETAFMAVVQQERNRLLIEHIRKCADSGCDVFVTYGAAHFSPKQKQQFDVLAFLQEQGFERKSREDIPVF